MKKVKKWYARVGAFLLILLLMFSVTAPGNTVFAEAEEPEQQEAVADTKEQPNAAAPELKEQPDKAVSAEQVVKEKNEEFDAGMPFTLASLENVDSYSMEMNDGISIENFKLVAENEDPAVSTACELRFPEELKSIQGGLVESKVPAVVNNQNGIAHAYSYAHVGNTKIYYMGKLKIYNDGKEENYIFYTTDRQIDKRTVYVVLKDHEQIELVYKHGTYYNIDYQFQNMDGNKLPEDAENGWTYDKVFGEKRVRTVGEGESFGATVDIPRGYTASVLVKKEGETAKTHTDGLGKMMKFYKNGNQLYLTEDSPKSMQFHDVISEDDISTNMTVIVQYKRVEKIAFNAYMWSQTQYASGRIQILNASGGFENPNVQNSTLTTDGHSFTWEMDGISSGGVTWEMNQFEINDERILVPMTSLSETAEKTETTMLSTGTKVTLTVHSLGGSNGNGGRRHYKLQIDNCYEDVTVSGGNMVGHFHREFALHRLEGVDGSEYYQSLSNAGWKTMEQDTLIDKRNNGYNIYDPLRFKMAIGYQKMHVSFTTKEGVVLQTDSNSKDASTYIQYLNRIDNDNSDNKNIRGEYTSVSYEEWEPSADGYYYCCGTDVLDRFMKSGNQYGVVLVNIYADPVKNAIDYQSGAGDGTSGPQESSIENMPQFQDGGKEGYNIRNNSVALVSNLIPVDKDEKFSFDHWEILLVQEEEPGTEVKKDSDGNPYKLTPGNDLDVSVETMQGLEDCTYYNKAHDRNTLTLRAVWKERGINDPIPYSVNYYIVELKDGKKYSEQMIEQHQHTVNEGATLVADLWQDNNKTLSPVIQDILEGDNDNRIDYTEGDNEKWVIWEKDTTKRIDCVDDTHDVAKIYLVKQPDFSVSKVVGGEFGDRTKEFKFTITAKDYNDKPLNGSYSCNGELLPNMSHITEPTEESIEFENGTATISLSHGQMITLTNLPVACRYTVTEIKEEGYEPSYNNEKSQSVSGILDADTTISVVNEKMNISQTGVKEYNSMFIILSGIGITAILLMIILEVLRRQKKA